MMVVVVVMTTRMNMNEWSTSGLFRACALVICNQAFEYPGLAGFRHQLR